MLTIIRIICLAALFSSCTLAAELHLAVTANFANTMDKLKLTFEQQNNIKLIISKGSTSKLYAQINNGAPFDVFLAADQLTPSKLVQQELAEPSSQITYAIGRLAVWAPGKTINVAGDEVIKVAKILQHINDTSKIAIANPKLAPYGRAALQCLTNLGLYARLRNNLLIGEDVTQAFSFTATNNAAYGLVALSQILHFNRGLLDHATWIVPQNLYDPIIQQAVILKKSNNLLQARLFIQFLQSASAKTIILNSGYNV